MKIHIKTPADVAKEASKIKYSYDKEEPRFQFLYTFMKTIKVLYLIWRF